MSESDVPGESGYCGLQSGFWEWFFKAEFEAIPEQGVGAGRWLFYSAEIVVCSVVKSV